MKKRKGILKRGLSVCLCLLIALSLWAPSRAASGTEYKAILEKTLSTLRETVTDPGNKSVGGEWAVLALARGGLEDDAWYGKYLSAVAAKVDSCGGVLHKRKYTEYSRTILGLTAVGTDAVKFDTGSGVYDLVSPLLDRQDNGEYWASWQGNNGTVFALIALDSNNYLDNATGRQARADLLDALLREQQSDGGWSISSGASDIDVTAMALQALAPYCLSRTKFAALGASHSFEQLESSVSKALGFLDGKKADDYGSVEAAAQVVVALAALNRDAADDALLGDVLSSVLAYYNGNGGFNHVKDGSDGNNQMSAEQAAYALVAYDRWKNGQTSLYDMTDRFAAAVTVRFAPNGGSGTMADATVTEGEKLTLPECSFTPPEGMEFDAWDAGEPGVSIAVTGDMTVTALWKELPSEVYTVTFKAGGGSGTMADATVTEGEKFTLPACAFTAPEGKEFRAWSVKGEKYAPGASLTVTEDLAVKALWKEVIEPCAVSFDGNGGKGSMESVTVSRGNSLTLPECSFTAPEGMKYRSWSIDGVEYLPCDVYRVEADVVVAALWQKTACVVSFDGNGGSGTMGAVAVAEGEKLTLPECSFAAPEGKRFKAWKVDGREYAPGDEAAVTADTTIRAVWVKDKVIAAVVFHLEGGEADGITDGKEKTFTKSEEGNALPKPTRDKYSFKGWYDAKSGGTQYTVVSADLPGDLYAQWKSSGSGGGSDGEKIKVTFRLIGAEEAKKDVDLGKEEYLPDYVTWIATKTYELDKGSTVYDLWVKATGEAGVRSEGAEQNYVRTVYAPDSLGGYDLSEFTNGKRSGWMYTINGAHPSFGLKEQELADGDRVIWHYVNDYSYEVADWFEDDSRWPSLGDGRYYNRWLKAADKFGGSGGGLGEGAKSGGGSDGGGSSGAAELIPTYDGDTVWIHADVEHSEADEKTLGGTPYAADATLTQEIAATGLEKANDKSKLKVWVDIEDSNRLVLSIEAEAVKEIADAKAGLRMGCSKGVIELDADAVAKLAESGKEVRLTVFYDDWYNKFNVSVTADHKVADVKMKIELPATKDGQALAIVNSDGAVTPIKKSAIIVDKVYALLTGAANLDIIELNKYWREVKEDDWFADAVHFVVSHELMNGVDRYEFAPNMSMTRAMLVTVLYRLEDEPEFNGSLASFGDVDVKSWYAEAVAWASETGLVNGTDRGFEPNANITREQIATILFRYAKYIGLDTSEAGDVSTFNDGDSVSSWAQEAMAWAVKVGLFKGDDTGSLNPLGNATRAEVATLLMRLIRLIVTS